MDYKKKLERKAATFAGNQDEDQGDEEAHGHVEAIRALALEEEAGRVIFQSVAVTGLQLIKRVYAELCQARQAALSLGQREKLQSMEAEQMATLRALRRALSRLGTQMLDLGADRPDGSADGAEEEVSWWFALTETIEALEEGAQQMEALADGQPEDGPARRLSRLLARLLRRQHADLLLEADQWIS